MLKNSLEENEKISKSILVRDYKLPIIPFYLHQINIQYDNYILNNNNNKSLFLIKLIENLYNKNEIKILLKKYIIQNENLTSIMFGDLFLNLMTHEDYQDYKSNIFLLIYIIKLRTKLIN